MEWTRGPVIGRGSTAAVSLASAAGHLFAVKSAELSDSLPLQREQSLLSKLSSPHIVTYLGFDVTKENDESLYNLWIEYLSGGTLRELIHRHGGFLDLSTVRVFVNRIVEGLSYLHENGIAHCDLKSQNVLIGEDGPVIADLGCAKLIGGNSSPANFSGTPMFMAPEVARGEEQGFEADVWALGCLIIEMVTGANPWTCNSPDPVSLLYRIGFSEVVPEIPAWLPLDCRDFLGKCLIRDPRQRWTVEQLLGHPFLEGSGHWGKQTEVNGGSPVGVLDREFWDSTDGMASDLDYVETSRDTGMDCSAYDRIKKLACNTGSTAQLLPDWTDDADWITIRSSDLERPEHGLSLSDAVLEEAELDLSILANNNLYNLSYEENPSVVMNSDTNQIFKVDRDDEVVTDDFDLMDVDFELEHDLIIKHHTLLILFIFPLLTKFSIFYNL